MFFSFAQSTSVSVVFFGRALSFLLTSTRPTYCMVSKAKANIDVGSQGLDTLDVNYLLPKRARSTRAHNVLKKEREATHVWVRDQGQSPFTSPSPPCPLTFSLRACFLNLFTSPSSVTALSSSHPFVAPCWCRPFPLLGFPPYPGASLFPCRSSSSYRPPSTPFHLRCKGWFRVPRYH